MSEPITLSGPPPPPPPRPPRLTIPPAASRSIGLLAIVLGSLGGGAGVSELVRLVRGDQQRAVLERLDLIGRRIDGVQADVTELRREVGGVQRRVEADDAVRRSRDEEVRSLLRERPPDAPGALTVLDR